MKHASKIILECFNERKKNQKYEQKKNRKSRIVNFERTYSHLYGS